MAQTLLGLYPFAPARLLALIRPALPEWIDTVTVRNLRVGSGRVSIRFERGRDGSTTYDTFDRHGTLHVIAVPPPQADELGGWRDVLTRWIFEHAPGRTAAALRLAIGDDD
jgi:hypothetical protein